VRRSHEESSGRKDVGASFLFDLLAEIYLAAWTRPAEPRRADAEAAARFAATGDEEPGDLALVRYVVVVDGSGSMTTAPEQAADVLGALFAHAEHDTPATYHQLNAADHVGSRGCAGSKLRLLLGILLAGWVRLAPMRFTALRPAGSREFEWSRVLHAMWAPAILMAGSPLAFRAEMPRFAATDETSPSRDGYYGPVDSAISASRMRPGGPTTRPSFRSAKPVHTSPGPHYMTRRGSRCRHRLARLDSEACAYKGRVRTTHGSFTRGSLIASTHLDLASQPSPHRLALAKGR
jgi:hypothetical protein